VDSWHVPTLHYLVMKTYDTETSSSSNWQHKSSAMRPHPTESFEAHLLYTPPFMGCADNHIWDLHATPKRSFPCADRSQLLTLFTRDLVMYDTLTCFLDRVPPTEMRQRSIDAVRQLYTMVGYFEHLRDTRASLSASARTNTKGIQKKRLREALEILTRLATGLTTEDYMPRRPEGKRPHAIPVEVKFLTDRMYDALVTYGPKDRAYRDIAIYHAITAILIHFDIEQAPESKVIARLSKNKSARRNLTKE
jgi:hypothetical protein